MSVSIKRSKAKKIEQFIGDRVRIHVKDMQITDIDIQGDMVTGNAMEGFILEADENFLYMGGSPDEGYTHVVDIDVVGMIQLIDDNSDLKQIIELLNVDPTEGGIH